MTLISTIRKEIYANVHGQYTCKMSQLNCCKHDGLTCPRLYIAYTYAQGQTRHGYLNRCANDLGQSLASIHDKGSKETRSISEQKKGCVWQVIDNIILIV